MASRLAQDEGAKFWLQVLTELQVRGWQDILILCCDGLKGLPEAVASIFLKTTVQTCVVHLVRYCLRLIGDQDGKPVAADLKTIYQAATPERSTAKGS